MKMLSNFLACKYTKNKTVLDILFIFILQYIKDLKIEVYT